MDDVLEVGRLVQRMLAREHGAEVTTSGDEALALVAARHFDVVVCDVMMPEIAGPELHEKLSRIRPGLARRMVFITGGAFTANAAEFLARVPNQRLDKPFGVAELRSAIARTLSA